MSLTTEKIDISSISNLAFDEMSSATSLMYIKENKCPKIQPYVTPASMGVHEED